jgi:hypothetical protein
VGTLHTDAGRRDYTATHYKTTAAAWGLGVLGSWRPEDTS